MITTQVPSHAYISVWLLEDKRLFLTMTNRSSYEAWNRDPVEFVRRRLSRFNAKRNRRFPSAIAVRVMRFISEEVAHESD